MTPVVAVCPEHGPFRSQAIEIVNSRGIVLEGNIETCPRCGTVSPIMDGTFDFDADGIATVINAPGWSRKALDAVQGLLGPAADALLDEKVATDHAYRLLSEQMVELGRSGDANTQRLIDAITAQKPKLSRKKFGAFLLGVLLLLGYVSDVGGAIEVSSDVVESVVTQVHSGDSPGKIRQYLDRHR
jgi:hypothetical protein